MPNEAQISGDQLTWGRDPKLQATRPVVITGLYARPRYTRYQDYSNNKY